MDEPLLKVEGLCVSFRIGKRDIPAIEDVGFSLYKGETLGIVGESGCGKSVTANTIMGLLPKYSGKITAGSVRLKGREITAMTEKQQREIRGNEISMIFQEPMTSLNPVYTIGTQMVEMARAHRRISRKEALARSLEMLRRVEIPEPEQRLREYPHQLSGGMRQRVMIAMAMMCEPDVLIADEPTTALDVTIQAQILDLMNGLKKTSQTAIMLITHDMGVVAESTDHVLVMYAGQVVESNSTENIFNHPLHPYTQGLLKAIPRPDEDTDTLYTIPGRVPTLEEMPSGCRFAERCPYATEKCVSQGPKLVSHGEGQVRCWKYGEG
ncbi:MAG TPA: ABC transporter ATP-binding protein [Candidatus Galloscillospira stercoripullorum]|nr:ABC transporter ATP-binding protein [Candidatus Galloscillospira stercoripullorum]